MEGMRRSFRPGPERWVTIPTFLILCYDQPEVLQRLVAHLAPYPVIVHVDAKSDVATFRDALASMDHVEILRNDERVMVRWGGFSMVRAMRHLADRGLRITPLDDHLVFLSGADYPLRPIREFVDHLRNAPYRQHIRSFDAATADALRYKHVHQRHFMDVVVFPRAQRRTLPSIFNSAAKRGLNRSLGLLPFRSPPNAMRPAFGSQWFAVTAECMAALRAMHSVELDRWFKRVFAPDEKYFHTLVAATRHHADTVTGTFESFDEYRRTLLANFHLLDLSLTKWYTVEDWDVVEQSPMFFLRKVRLPESATLLDRLDERIGRS